MSCTVVVYLAWEFSGDGVVITGRHFRGVFGSEEEARSHLDHPLRGPTEITTQALTFASTPSED